MFVVFFHSSHADIPKSCIIVAGGQLDDVIACGIQVLYRSECGKGLLHLHVHGVSLSPRTTLQERRRVWRWFNLTMIWAGSSGSWRICHCLSRQCRVPTRPWDTHRSVTSSAIFSCVIYSCMCLKFSSFVLCRFSHQFLWGWTIHFLRKRRTVLD